MKHSTQRDAILNELCSRKDHPTADELYCKLRQTIPNISMGTVYRNLSLLADNGQIRRITCGGADRFDAKTNNHYHLECTHCGKVIDIEMPVLESIEKEVEKHSNVAVFTHQLTFIGICEDCKNFI